MSVDEQREELQRILQSPQFRRAPKLQKLLELICKYHFDNRSSEINEFLIATEAFGKRPGFDPSQDSIVRVQAREARRRLREYYQVDGKDSRLILDIPIGSYIPSFTAADSPPVPKQTQPLRPAWRALAALALILVAVLVFADIERRRSFRNSTAAAAPNTPAALSPSLTRLWNRFIVSDAPTILVLSNPAVTSCEPAQVPAGAGGASGGSASPQEPCPDEYTGMGEAVALHLITEIFKAPRNKLTVKQSRLLSGDDVQRSNLIVLGGPSVNPWTRTLGPDLSLTEAAKELALEFPGQPEQEQYETVIDSKTGKLTRDRGIIALRRHAETRRWLLFLYGMHSQGTHAVAEAATDERFLSRLNWPASAKPFPERFRILVGVTVHESPPYESASIAVRVP